MIREIVYQLLPLSFALKLGCHRFYSIAQHHAVDLILNLHHALDKDTPCLQQSADLFTGLAARWDSGSISFAR